MLEACELSTLAQLREASLLEGELPTVAHEVIVVRVLETRMLPAMSRNVGASLLPDVGRELESRMLPAVS